MHGRMYAGWPGEMRFQRETRYEMLEDNIVERYLAWDGCSNIRDLGGLPASEDGRIRRGALIRADNLCQLTPAGQAALIAYGVRTIVDLRSPSEAALAPHPFATEDAAAVRPKYLHLPLFDASDEPVIAALTAAASPYETYVVFLERCRPQLASALCAIAYADDGPVLVHCHAGKDRTGLVVALSLAVAGVPGESIAADYALSDLYLQRAYQEILARYAGKPDAPQHLMEQLTSYPEAMLQTLAYLELTYSGLDRYLYSIGLTDADCTRLRDRLREPA